MPRPATLTRRPGRRTAVTRTRIGLVSGLLLVLALAVAGCGGGGNSNMTSPGGSSDPKQAALNWARCMRQHGITNMPDPKFTAEGIEQRLPARVRADDPRVKAAEQACQQHSGYGDGR
jgi:hypothetical protein